METDTTLVYYLFIRFIIFVPFLYNDTKIIMTTALNSQNRSISVVMCTFNGEKYLREQLDSILRQTYPVLELIVQDDGSTDNTCLIIEEYAAQYPFIKLYRNECQFGVVQNFFSAMQRAQGDLIALSDQDDIWEDNKLELQVNAIGDSKCCAGKSAPFAADGVSLSIDSRPSNYNLLRLLFVGSVAGHTMLITKSLLEETVQLSASFPIARLQDTILAFVATSHNSIVYVDSVLVHHRRHQANTTATYFDPHGNDKSIGNIFKIFHETGTLYRRLRHQIIKILKSQEDFLSKIDSQEPILQDALKILHLYRSRYFIDFVRLSFFCARRGNLLTFARGKQTFYTYLFGAFFPIYSARYYKWLL